MAAGLRLRREGHLESRSRKESASGGGGGGGRLGVKQSGKKRRSGAKWRSFPLEASEDALLELLASLQTQANSETYPQCTRLQPYSLGA